MKKTFSYEEWSRQLGFVSWGHHLAWTEYGFGWWLPMWMKEAIIDTANWTACRFFGHQDFGTGECVSCCKVLPRR